MAKESVSKFERHVEKGVLGLTATVLLGAVAWFGVMQPNSLTFEGQDTVTPTTVGDKVMEKADFLRRKLVGADPTAVAVESALPRFEEALDPLAYAGVDERLPSVVAWQPMVPPAGRLAPQEGELLLASVPKTTRPIVTAGRTTLLQLPPGIIGEGTNPGAGIGIDRTSRVVYEVAANWVTVAAVFNLEEQQKRNRLANYSASLQSVDMLGLELQRRAQRADGTWADSDWESISSYRTYELPQTPQVNLTASSNGMRADPESRIQAQYFWESITPPDKQLELMRPQFPLPLNGSPWKPPVIEGVDLLKIDNELSWPDDASHRYDEFDISPTGKTPIDIGELADEWLEQAEAAVEQGKWDTAEAHLDDFRTITASTKAQQERAEKLREEIEVGREIDRVRGIQNPTRDQQAGPPPRTPEQMLWAHDARRGSVQGGATYQYRVRARVYNRYFAQPTQLKTDEDATKVAITGEWSEPSDPIYIPPESRFFVKTAVVSKGLAKVHAFQWESGVVVTETLEVRPGESIFDVSREDLPDGPPRVVAFDTGATVVDLDFARPIYERKRGKVDFESRPTETLAMVYLDADGILREKLLSLDKEAPEYRQAKGDVYKVPLERKEEGRKIDPSGGRRGAPMGKGKGGRPGAGKGKRPPG